MRVAVTSKTAHLHALLLHGVTNCLIWQFYVGCPSWHKPKEDLCSAFILWDFFLLLFLLKKPNKSIGIQNCAYSLGFFHLNVRWSGQTYLVDWLGITSHSHFQDGLGKDKHKKWKGIKERKKKKNLNSSTGLRTFYTPTGKTLPPGGNSVFYKQ